MSIQAGAATYPGEKPTRWRGVLDTVEEKTGALGPYTSGERIWRCFHKHRTEAVAVACAQREQLAREGKRAGANDLGKRLVVGRDQAVRTAAGRELGRVFQVYAETWETSCTVDGCGWARDTRYQRDGVSELHMHHLSKHRPTEGNSNV